MRLQVSSYGLLWPSGSSLLPKRWRRPGGTAYFQVRLEPNDTRSRVASDGGERQLACDLPHFPERMGNRRKGGAKETSDSGIEPHDRNVVWNPQARLIGYLEGASRKDVGRDENCGQRLSGLQQMPHAHLPPRSYRLLIRSEVSAQENNVIRVANPGGLESLLIARKALFLDRVGDPQSAVQDRVRPNEPDPPMP
jgi:hypothetical protein